ncbi:AAA family ATPase [Mycobacterium sp. M23085]|uniref:AAA family ATPase n=1 Tax=Mycobacterium sp. M23085 TaxID=3378087 RepID=UPI0038779A51
MSNNIEIQLLSHLTTAEGIALVTEEKLGPEVFEDPPNRAIFEFALDYWQKYGKVPTREILVQEWPPLEKQLLESLEDSKDAAGYIIERLRKRYTKNGLNEMLISSAQLAADDPVAALKHLHDGTTAMLDVAGRPDQHAVLEHRRAVEAELGRQRVREEARRRLVTEKAGPALPFEWGLLSDLEDPDESPFRIDGLLPAGGGMAVVAQRKTGKTTLMLNLARSLITGEPFLGRFDTKPVTGRVAFLNFEVSSGQLGRWAHQTDIPADRLFLVNLRGRRNPLQQPVDRQLLADKLREHRVEVLIVDPFGRAYTGASQNDPHEVGRWLADLDVFARSEVGATEVILAVHAGWNAERTRGSSAVEDWADSIMTMTFGGDQQTRYLRAIGRDVSVDQDQLSYDPVTRLLTTTGSGTRAQVERVFKAQALVDPVCQCVDANPGTSQNAIEKGVRASTTVGFQAADVREAIKIAEEKGRLRREGGGSRGKTTKHFPAGAEPQPGQSIEELQPGESGGKL